MASISKGFTWKLLERFGVQGVQFLLQIVLARLLSPEDYGILSLMLVFTNLANVFIQSGFNTSLIQNKDVTDEDFSSVFWVSLFISCVLYGVIFVCAPVIGNYYEMPSLVQPLRVISLMLIPGAFNSVQLAKVSRELDFRKVFFSNVGGIISGGIIGIVLAYAGVGIWALVAQNLVNTSVACIVMYKTVNWRPRLVINWSRIKVLFGFGWKLLASSLLDTLYQDLQSLVIGKKFDEGTLGYCNRGKQFPQFAMNAINSSVQSVMLPAMSAKQDNAESVKSLTRRSITLESYIVFPMMAGLVGVATPLINLILTDKWLPCVPYMSIYCIAFAFYPIYSSNLQAINAVGRSDIFLKLEIVKKLIGVFTLVIALICFDTPIAIAMTAVITIPLDLVINAGPNKKLIGYSYKEQIKDILPSAILAGTMCGLVLLAGKLPFNNLLVLCAQIAIGVVYYIGVSAILRFEPYVYLYNTVRPILKKIKH